jgi:hypothetical protein
MAFDPASNFESDGKRRSKKEERKEERKIRK